MGERIEALEDALASLQASISREPHPLLRQDLLRVKSTAEFHQAHGLAVKFSSGSSDDPAESEYTRPQSNQFDYHTSVEPTTPIDPYWCRTEQTPVQVSGKQCLLLQWPTHDHYSARPAYRAQHSSIITASNDLRFKRAIPCSLEIGHSHPAGYSGYVALQGRSNVSMRSGPAKCLVAVCAAPLNKYCVAHIS